MPTVSTGVIRGRNRWRYEARDGGFDNDLGRGGALAFSVTPTKILAFTKGNFSQTSYRF